MARRLMGNAKMRFICGKNGELLKGAPGNFKCGEIVSQPFYLSEFPFWELVDPMPELKTPYGSEKRHTYNNGTSGGPKTIPNTMLIIVDTYDWAWDIASQELLKAMPSVKGKVVDLKDCWRENTSQYNVVMIYPWGNTFTGYLDPKNTVICVAGGEQLDMLPTFKNRCEKFRVYGACSKTIQDTLKKEFPNKTVLHLIHGVDHKLFAPTEKRRSGGFSVGWVGSTQRGLKRYPLAEEIAENGGFELHTASFKKYPHDKMPQFYHDQDALLVTSSTEAHPLVVYEAMSCGLPVVTTDVGDVREYIVSGENGFILPVNAPVMKFVEVINRLKKDVKLRLRVGEAARQTVVEKLSWDEIAKQYVPLMKLMEVK